MVSQAFNLTTSLHCADWWNAQWSQSISAYFNVNCKMYFALIALIAAGTTHHHWACNVTYFEGLLLNPLYCHSVAMLGHSGKTWQPLFQFCMPSIICDVLIGWSCSSEWQHPLFECKNLQRKDHTCYASNIIICHQLLADTKWNGQPHMSL